MTLFISFLLIHGFQLPSIWYFVAFVLWIMHLLYHDKVSDKTIEETKRKVDFIYNALQSAAAFKGMKL